MLIYTGFLFSRNQFMKWMYLGENGVGKVGFWNKQGLKFLLLLNLKKPILMKHNDWHSQYINFKKKKKMKTKFTDNKKHEKISSIWKG